MRVGRRRWWKAAFAVVVLGAAGFALVARPWESKPPVVSVETVEPGPISRVLAINGRVAARRSVAVRSAVPGQVVDLAADVGQAVREGDTIIRLDTAQPQSQVAQAQAALEAGMVRLRQAQATESRTRALADITAQSALENAQLELAAAQSEVARLQGSLDQVKSQLSQYTIVAPLSGVVVARNVDPGQVIDTQTSLLTIADLSSLVVEADVDEIYSAQIKTGLKAILQPAGDTQVRKGSVYFAAPSVDASTGGRAVKIAFDEPVSLPIGLTVNANIVVAEEPSAISVPRAAIIAEGTDRFVMLADGNTASRRQIEVIEWPAERVVVTQGLEKGDKVILDPAGLVDGQAIKIPAE